MTYRSLDSNRDYVLGRGKNGFLSNSPACVAQAVLTSLLLMRGEWFLDVTKGVPYVQQILGYNTRPFYDSIIQNVIEGVTGVTGIVSYSSTLVNRALTIQAVIDTLFGKTKVVGPNGQVPTLFIQPHGYGLGGFGIGGFGQ